MGQIKNILIGGLLVSLCLVLVTTFITSVTANTTGGQAYDNGTLLAINNSLPVQTINTIGNQTASTIQNANPAGVVVFVFIEIYNVIKLLVVDVPSIAITTSALFLTGITGVPVIVFTTVEALITLIIMIQLASLLLKGDI